MERESRSRKWGEIIFVFLCNIQHKMRTYFFPSQLRSVCDCCWHDTAQLCRRCCSIATSWSYCKLNDVWRSENKINYIGKTEAKRLNVTMFLASWHPRNGGAIIIQYMSAVSVTVASFLDGHIFSFTRSKLIKFNDEAEFCEAHTKLNVDKFSIVAPLPGPFLQLSCKCRMSWVGVLCRWHQFLKSINGNASRRRHTMEKWVSLHGTTAIKGFI